MKIFSELRGGGFIKGVSKNTKFLRIKGGFIKEGIFIRRSSVQPKLSEDARRQIGSGSQKL